MITLDKFIIYCLAKPGVEESYPFKRETVWMKVSGKLFAMTNVLKFRMNDMPVAPFHFINLKCDPERAIELREKHDSILPGWHQNKKHWNTLLMDGSINQDIIFDLIDHSYNIVAKTLSKKEISNLDKKQNESI